jgi:hypothetical protein
MSEYQYYEFLAPAATQVLPAPADALERDDFGGRSTRTRRKPRQER